MKFAWISARAIGGQTLLPHMRTCDLVSGTRGSASGLPSAW